MNLVKLSDESEVEIRKPTAKQLAEAQKFAGKMFVQLINEKDEAGNPTALFKSQLMEQMKANGLWSDKDEDRFNELDKQIMQKEKEATETRSKSAARQLALDIRELRGEKLMLITKRNQLDLFTVETQVDNAKFEYLVSLCVYKTDGSKMFSSVEDYQERANSPDANKVAGELSKMMYGLTDDFHARLIENKILKKVGAVDDQYRLINAEGKLVDADGKLIDEDGYWLNENGQRVDEDGNLLEYNIDDVEYTED